MNWPPYTRSLAGRNRTPTCPPPLTEQLEHARRVAWRGMLVVFVYLLQAMLLTANAAWWHVQGVGFLIGLGAANVVLACGLIMWVRKR